jgi:glutamate/aspartate transport system permease protein
MSDFDTGVILRALPFLWEGMQLTLLLTVLAMAGGVVLGTVLALMRLSLPPPWPQLAAGYVNLLRSIPLILVVFWFYFLVPYIGQWITGSSSPIRVGAFMSSLVTFALFEAAFFSEIMRAGIQSIARGQMAAAQALGMNYRTTMSYIVLPQAFRNMVPVLLTQGIILFQDTSLVYVVGLHDFLTAATIVAGRDNRVVELYIFVAFVYLVFCLAGSLGVRSLQARRIR